MYPSVSFTVNSTNNKEKKALSNVFRQLSYNYESENVGDYFKDYENISQNFEENIYCQNVKVNERYICSLN